MKIILSAVKQGELILERKEGLIHRTRKRHAGGYNIESNTQAFNRVAAHRRVFAAGLDTRKEISFYEGRREDF